MADEVMKIGFEPDNASIERTKQAVSGVEKDIAKIGTAMEKAARSQALDDLPKRFAKVAAETGDTEKAVAELNAELKKLDASEKEIDRVAAAFTKASKAAREASENAESLAQQRFDKVSQDVGLAGDAESAVRTIGGAAGFFGGSGIEQATGAAGEILATIEALPRLKESLLGLPQTIGSAVTSLGPVGIAAAAALAVVAVAISDLAAQAQEQADQINATIDATRSINEKIAAGLTTEDAEAEIANLERRRQLEQEVLAESQAAYESFIEGIRQAFGPLAPIVEGFLKVFDTREDALNAQIEKSKDITAGYTAEIDALNAAMNDGKTAANDRANTEKETTSQPKSSSSTSSANDAARDAEKAANDAARAREKAATDAQRAQEKAAADAKRQADQIAQAQDTVAKSGEKYRNSIQDINRSFENSIEDIQRKAVDTDSDTRKKFNRDIASLSLKAQDDEKKARLKSYQELEKIDKDYRKNLADIAKSAADAEESARSNRNFLQLEQSRKEQVKALDAAKEDAQSAVNERLEVDKQEAADRLENLKIARRDRKMALDQELSDNRLAQQRQERDAAINRDRQLEQAKVAHEREQAELQKHLMKLLSARTEFYSAEMSAAAGSSNRRGSASEAVPQSPFAPFGGGGIPSAPLRGGGTTTNINNSRGNITVNSGADARDVLKVLKQAGYA